MFKGMEESVECKEMLQREVNEYQKIHPEGNITPEEARDYWDKLYKDLEISEAKADNPRREVIDGKVNYFDDNGTLYRVDDNLLEKNKYELNGYRYETDDNARIVSAEGVLHMKNREGRLPIRDSIEDIGKGDQLENDDRGHLIGDQFDGPNGMENMIPQDAEINRNDFKNFENELASMVKAGDEVKVEIEPIYDGQSRRPTDIVVTYSINGIEDVRIFPNGEEN